MWSYLSHLYSLLLVGQFVLENFCNFYCLLQQIMAKKSYSAKKVRHTICKGTENEVVRAGVRVRKNPEITAQIVCPSQDCVPLQATKPTRHSLIYNSLKHKIWSNAPGPNPSHVEVFENIWCLKAGIHGTSHW